MCEYSVAGLTVFNMDNQQKFPNSVLYQRVEQIYRPAESWEECELPMTTEQLIIAVNESLPGYFEDPEQILRIFEDLHFIYARNEHNNKHYWLINPAE